MSQTVTVRTQNRYIRLDPCDSLTPISEGMKVMNLKLTIYSRNEVTRHTPPPKVFQR